MKRSTSVPSVTEIWKSLTDATKGKSFDALIDTTAERNEYKFCFNMPHSVRTFVASIIHSTLYQIYGDENGNVSHEASQHFNHTGGSATPCDIEACNLINKPLERMLKPLKPNDENIWISKAKLKKTPDIPPNITWPSNEEFTQDLGVKNIRLYITSWGLTCGWVYIIKPLPPKEKEFWVEYYYEVLFCIPTRRTPVPKHTVSVFFTLCKSKYKSGKLPVDVWYVVESFSQKHRPEKHIFNEEWLKTVLDFKAKLGETLLF
uniref:Aida_C2 domain-containing protein n=2 Tax=Mesocestoides corti TaxID=53468 RepID=A0A5K3EHZ2_MESCO